MKIIKDNKIYLQKKDLELIIKTVNEEKISLNLIDKYKESSEKKDLEFIILDGINDIEFINNFWFIIDYKDFMDLTYLENTDFYISDLNKLRAMRIEYDKHKFLDEKKNIVVGLKKH